MRYFNSQSPMGSSVHGLKTLFHAGLWNVKPLRQLPLGNVLIHVFCQIVSDRLDFLHLRPVKVRRFVNAPGKLRRLQKQQKFHHF